MSKRCGRRRRTDKVQKALREFRLKAVETLFEEACRWARGQLRRSVVKAALTAYNRNRRVLAWVSQYITFRRQQALAAVPAPA